MIATCARKDGRGDGISAPEPQRNVARSARPAGQSGTAAGTVFRRRNKDLTALSRRPSAAACRG